MNTNETHNNSNNRVKSASTESSCRKWICGLMVLYCGAAGAMECTNTVTADVVAMDQVFYYNRFGAMNPSGMIYALREDVVDLNGGSNPGPGEAMLRPGKRPRPLVLRVNEGDCLTVNFTNWLSPTVKGSLTDPVAPSDPNPNATPVRNDDGPATRMASFHVIGMQLNDIGSDGSNVGVNVSSLVGPGESGTYTFYAQKEGTYLAYSSAAMTGGEGDGGSIAHGLFGAVNVEGPNTSWYRSQVTELDLALAATGSSLDPEGSGKYYPVIDYDAVYPAVETRKSGETLTVTDNGDGTCRASLSNFNSDSAFIAGDLNKTLVDALGNQHIIMAIDAIDGSATVGNCNLASLSEPYTWKIVGVTPHPLAGRPILNLLAGSQIKHSDLNAVITGTNDQTDQFYQGVYPRRYGAFREFTAIFHDEIKSVQAFPAWYNDPVLRFTLHGVKDGFGVNYGTGGIGSEIIANRLGLGPQKDCVECKYEEFFLTSWALGDPAMVVDVPTGINAQGLGAKPIEQQMAATKAYFPDDPSNVHHSYLGDRVKIRNLHAGPKEHHIFHLHAHQWLHSPKDDESAYLDSQSIGPGAGYTYEITHGGSGNRNLTAGDSIFHCHFYPHFAQGMWELWRVHDVLESGTVLSADGRPALGSRALPDHEILTGTPIPAVVPIPGIAMAPLPGVKATVNHDSGEIVLPELAANSAENKNPGYPFYIAGVAGHRPPRPPRDVINDGGLPRHVVTGGTAMSSQTRLDFNKTIETLSAIELPENGTVWERQAMIFHGGDGLIPGFKQHQTLKPDGNIGQFRVNGLPAVAGAPYADPCVDDDQNPTGNMRNYHVAAIQMDAKMNKMGWHFPQQRILTLWDDVADTLDGIRPPEPLFFRANSGECIELTHTNLVPNIYAQDDFQVVTPTDIIGQHIHLVKFDVTSSDGSGNGWNYEDGTFSPQEIHERLAAINTAEGSWNGNGQKPPVCQLTDDFRRGTGGCIQTTVQRWYADDVTNQLGTHDRTLRTVFTHDHFGPSTHQHPGLYAGLVIEPVGSSWKHNENGTALGDRTDGGPTTWQAIIEPGDGSEPYREFLLEMGDFSLAYRSQEEGNTPVNPPAKVEVDVHNLLAVAPTCPGGAPRPCPEAISLDDPGTMTVNYRNEPVALRVHDPATGGQTAGEAGDLAHAFESRTDRAIAQLNTQPQFFVQSLTEDLLPGDPFTPMLKAYAGDRVQIRILQGAHEEGHNFGIDGVRWLFEPSAKNSGYKNGQMLGISEHFEFQVDDVAKVKGNVPWVDYPYFPGAASDDIWNGVWGLIRAYNGKGSFSEAYPAPTLAKLPNNLSGAGLAAKPCQGNPNNCTYRMVGVCPADAPTVNLKVHAYLARDLLGGPLVYNQVADLTDPGAIMYIRDGDLDKKSNRLKAGVPIEPLILRVNAGDCVYVTLENHLPADISGTQQDGWSTLPMIVEGFNNNDILPSTEVGLTPQLLDYDVLSNSGMWVGSNSAFWTLTNPTAPPGGVVKYKWYAGKPTKVDVEGTMYRYAEPVEYGAVNLLPADRVKQTSKGAIAALIVEPQGSTWQEDLDKRASATVTMAGGLTSFREHVLIFQNDLNLQMQGGMPVPNLAQAEDPEDSGQKGFNYRSEPFWARMGYPADTPLETTRTFDFTPVLSGNTETPIFTASAGTEVRFRVLHPGGHPRNHVFQLHGHGWQEEPFMNDSKVIGDNPLSEWKGSQDGIGPRSHLNLLLTNGAGGYNGVVGDFLYRDQSSFYMDGGLFGIFRVE
ncbi:MAG: copper oxidase [Gammaproteobacteria bacterium]